MTPILARSIGLTVVIVGLSALGGCAQTTTDADPALGGSGPTTIVATTAPVTTTMAPTTTTTIDPGTLPQTDEKPVPSGEQWDNGVAGLWRAIVTDDPDQAKPFFFPLSAYRQVKGIADPDHDYATRLIAFYTDDIHTLHTQLGASAATAQFVRLDVNTSGIEWIKPGVEYNKGAYWRVQQNTLRYTVNGQPKSFPVASMISWRGQWYVVHLSSVR